MNDYDRGFEDGAEAIQRQIEEQQSREQALRQALDEAEAELTELREEVGLHRQHYDDAMATIARLRGERRRGERLRT